MIPIGIRDLEAATSSLFDRRSRVIGWGSGSYFDYFQERFPIRLEYLVDNDRRRVGRWRRGTPIVGPDRLRQEDPAQTIVLIYSAAWPEIQQQIETLGPFRALPAAVAFADVRVRESLALAEELAARPPASRGPRSTDAIVVQGPVVPQVTARVLRVMAARHAGVRIVLSTWDDTPAAMLDDLRPFVDDLVLSAQPALAGIQNRNNQIVSTRAGIERAIAQGARTILKTRTDLAVLGEALFARARSLTSRFGEGAPRRWGLKGRLLVPSSYTRKYLLYHPSDLVMVGHAEDMATYWSAPLDARDGELVTADSIDLSLAAVNMSGNPAESYFGLSFCRAINRPALGTLADSWSFYRDLFVVAENDWFDLLWYKNPSIPDAAVRRGVRQLVSESFWHRLYIDDPAIAQDMNAVDPHRLALRTLAGAA